MAHWGGGARPAGLIGQGLAGQERSLPSLADLGSLGLWWDIHGKCQLGRLCALEAWRPLLPALLTTDWTEVQTGRKTRVGAGRLPAKPGQTGVISHSTLAWSWPQHFHGALGLEVSLRDPAPRWVESVDSGARPPGLDSSCGACASCLTVLPQFTEL